MPQSTWQESQVLLFCLNRRIQSRLRHDQRPRDNVSVWLRGGQIVSPSAAGHPPVGLSEQLHCDHRGDNAALLPVGPSLREGQLSDAHLILLTFFFVDGVGIFDEQGVIKGTKVALTWLLYGYVLNIALVRLDGH